MYNLIERIFQIIISIVVAIDQGLIPALPSGFAAVWDTVLQYLGQGFSFIAEVFDLSFARQLIGWWIATTAALLSIEIVYGIWKKVTGNAGREATSESTTFDGDGQVISTRATRSRSRPRLPRL